MQALNKVLAHAGISGTSFDSNMINDVNGFDGNKMTMSEADQKSYQTMREYFAPSIRELTQLLQVAGIEFDGIPEENPMGE